jgi:hypothetical protein
MNNIKINMIYFIKRMTWTDIGDIGSYIEAKQFIHKILTDADWFEVPVGARPFDQKKILRRIYEYYLTWMHSGLTLADGCLKINCESKV